MNVRQKLSSLGAELNDRFRNYSLNINWFVFIFVLVFTTGSWITLNGMWCELPIMVHELPEGWRLPSILGVLIQFSQTAAFLFVIFRFYYGEKVSLAKAIYIILAIGVFSCLPLAYLWQKTAQIGAERRSIALYFFTFTLGILDATSTVTFLPYIGNHFAKEYIIPNYIGESFSGLIPSVLGLIQGVGDSDQCSLYLNYTLNSTLNTTNELSSNYSTPILQKSSSEPKFSVKIYFLLLMFVLISSIGGFSLLHFAPISIKNRKVKPETENDQMDIDTFDRFSYTSLSSIMDSRGSQVEVEIIKVESVETLSRRNKIYLLTVNSMTSFLIFGFLPGILSYATLPYGKGVFHLAINLSNVLTPFVILLSIFSYKTSLKRVTIEFSIAFVMSIYVLAIAVKSPCPPFLHSWFGSAFIVLIWIVISCIFVRIRCLIAVRLQHSGQDLLSIFGCLTSLGQIIGGILIFVLVDIYRVFTDLSSCQSSKDFCTA